VPRADDDAGATRISHGDFRCAPCCRRRRSAGTVRGHRPGVLACAQVPGRAARRVSGHACLCEGWMGGLHAGWPGGLCALLGRAAPGRRLRCPRCPTLPYTLCPRAQAGQPGVWGGRAGGGGARLGAGHAGPPAGGPGVQRHALPPAARHARAAVAAGPAAARRVALLFPQPPRLGVRGLQGVREAALSLWQLCWRRAPRCCGDMRPSALQAANMRAAAEHVCALRTALK